MTVVDKNNIPELLKSLPQEKERILRLAGAFLEGRIKELITETPPEWPSLKPETIKRKGSSKPLIDTGRLINSITHKVEEDKALVGIFGEEVLIYAAVHEFGSPKRNIPQRSYLRLGFDKNKEELEKLIDKEIELLIKRYSIKF